MKNNIRETMINSSKLNFNKLEKFLYKFTKIFKREILHREQTMIMKPQMGENFDMKTDIYAKHEKENREYVGKLINLLLGYIANGTIPKTGRFNGASGRFIIIGSEYYYAYAGVVHDSEDSNKRDIKVGVTNAKVGYDIFEFDFNGTNAEMLEYLQSNDLADIWYEKFIKMAKRWDEKSGEYPF